MFTLSPTIQAPWSSGRAQGWDWKNLRAYRTSLVAAGVWVSESYLNYISVALPLEEGTKVTSNLQLQQKHLKFEQFQMAQAANIKLICRLNLPVLQADILICPSNINQSTNLPLEKFPAIIEWSTWRHFSPYAEFYNLPPEAFWVFLKPGTSYQILIRIAVLVL